MTEVEVGFAGLLGGSGLSHLLSIFRGFGLELSS